ncbi:hypothetical protein [Coleofasciculus sp. G2-EDA-02]
MLNPQDTRIWLNRGIALADWGKHEAAIASFDQVIEREPTLAQACLY